MVGFGNLLRDLTVASLAVMLCITPVAVNASPGEGFFQFSIKGHTVTGYLRNAVIQPDGTVKMEMIINSDIDTHTLGFIPINGNGVWQGMRSGLQLSGTIQDVTGTVYGCFRFLCGATTYVGSGQWIGSLSGATTIPDASGTFNGTIMFTNSSFVEIPLNTPQPIAGTWNAQPIQQLPG